ncbi:MAG: GAF domain-containing protein, partial [Moorea sp. SIO2B7]|nr:GAF domain-containing protein [Moorena sp. SIO2B7]
MTEKQINWTALDEGPIHIPGSIQPHGVLFVLQEPELTILQISKNTFEFFGIQPEALLNQKLNKLLDAYQIAFLQDTLANNQYIDDVNPLKLSVTTDKERLFFDGIIKRIEQNYRFLTLELLPALPPVSCDYFNLYQLLINATNNIQKLLKFSEYCESLVKEVRKITGFDRVMLYKFDIEDHGTVIAEDKRETMPTYLGLHFPSTDIPKRARTLFLSKGIRSIPDINSEPIEILPPNNPINHQPLNLSLAVLRSVVVSHAARCWNASKVSVAASSAVGAGVGVGTGLATGAGVGG